MSEKLWTKDFMLITLVNFLMYIIHYSLIVTVTVFTMEEYKASEGMGGLAAGIFIIGMLVGRLYSGKYIDQWQPKYILMIGLVASIATISLYFTIHSLVILMIVRFFYTESLLVFHLPLRGLLLPKLFLNLVREKELGTMH